MKIIRRRYPHIAIGAGVAALALVTSYAMYQPAQLSSRSMLATQSIHVTQSLAPPMMETVANITRNLPYCNTASPLQRLDLFVPKVHGSKAFPVVVLVHGGGWHQGDKADPLVGAYGINLVEHGMALASINYRLAPAATYPVQDQDVSCALSYLRTIAPHYYLDPTRLALFGNSAGGQLVAYAALSTADQAASWRPAIRGVVDFYGVSDLTNLPPGSHIDKVAKQFLGPWGQSRAAAASPVAYHPASAPPFLIFHGTADHKVPITQSEELTRELERYHLPVTFVKVLNGEHGFGGYTDPTATQVRTRLTNFLQNVLDIPSKPAV